MQILKQVLRTGTDTDTATDAETLRAKHGEAARRILTGQQELLVLSGQLELWKLERGGLLEEQDAGEDVTDAIRRVDGRITRAERERDDLGPRLAVRQQQAADLDRQLRDAERQEAPAKMAQLARHHAQKREALRTMAAELQALAHDIIVVESDMSQLHNQHGVTAPAVLVIEGVATPAQALAADIVSKLAWQDQQAGRGDDLAAKLEADRAEVDRANREAGYQLYRSPGVDFFTGGWLDETEEQRLVRVNG